MKLTCIICKTTVDGDSEAIAKARLSDHCNSSHLNEMTPAKRAEMDKATADSIAAQKKEAADAADAATPAV